MKELGLAGAIALGAALGGCYRACFARGTRVSTPKGKRRIEDLSVGDAVTSWDLETQLPVERRLTQVRSRVREDLARLRAGAIDLAGVTLDHPLYEVGARRWVEVGDLRLGARLLALHGDQAEIVRVTELERLPPGAHEVFDLSVEGPEHDFFAEGILAHNKTPIERDGGRMDAAVPDGTDAAVIEVRDGSSCFARGTLVATPAGAVPIESLSPGDLVLACDPATRTVVARRLARALPARRSALVELAAGGSRVAGVTQDHPMYDAERRAFVLVSELTLRSTLAALDGASIRPVPVGTLLSRPCDEEVFDLTIEGPEHDFFAEGLLAHNKSADASTPTDAAVNGDDAALHDAGSSDEDASDGA